ncbi:hypothetical protein ACP8HZ_00450 [Francisella noatunensis]
MPVSSKIKHLWQLRQKSNRGKSTMNKYANRITLKNFLNCYDREFNNYELSQNNDGGYKFNIFLKSSGF